MEPESIQEQPSRRQVWRMFDRIAGRYDLLNRLLSMGRDVAWRKRMARYLPPGDALHLIDVATGTADVLLFLHGRSGRIRRGTGVDMSSGMLARGREKIHRRGLDHDLALVRGDAVQLGLRENAADAVTIAFGIRNVVDVDAALREMYRVLKPGGRALILEFSLPSVRWLRRFYLFYFRHVLPRIGGIISGDRDAYRYLNATVESFPYGETFCALMRDAGFRDVHAQPLTFGIASLYAGDKQA